MNLNNLGYRAWRKFKKTVIRRALGNIFFYKYFPRVFLWARFSEAGNRNSEQYWNAVHGRENIGDAPSRFDNFILSFLDRINFSGKDILDVGCGRGIFLSQIQNTRSKTGIDISEEAVKIAGEKGIRAFVRTLPALNLTETFDIITCFETLEHTFAWKESIKEMIKLLKPEGYLIISVPNQDSIPMSEHVSYFDIPRLYKILKNKLSILEIKILGPWLLVVAQNRANEADDRLEYFFPK